MMLDIRIQSIVASVSDFAHGVPARYVEWRGRRLVLEHRAEIYEDLGGALKSTSGGSASGWSLLGQLEEWRDRAIGRGQPIGHIFALWAEGMSERGLFSEAAVGTLPTMEIISIATSEHAGQLGTGFIELAEDVRRLNALERAVKGMVYELAGPVLAMLAAILFFSVVYTAQLAEFVPINKMPPATQAFYKFGKWIPTWWPVVLGCAILFYNRIDWSLENWTGSLRDRLDGFPLSPYPYFRDYTAARLLVALNRRLKQGDTIKHALERIAEQSPPWLAMHCRRAIANIEEPKPTSEVLNTGLFNQDLMDRIADYIQQRGDFSAAIGNLAGQSFAQVERTILRNMTIIKGMVKLGLYGVVISMIGLVINTIVSTSNGFKF